MNDRFPLLVRFYGGPWHNKCHVVEDKAFCVSEAPKLPYYRYADSDAECTFSVKRHIYVLDSICGPSGDRIYFMRYETKTMKDILEAVFGPTKSKQRRKRRK